MDTLCRILTCSSSFASLRSRLVCRSWARGRTVWAVIALIACSLSGYGETKSPPSQLCSRDHSFCVEIIPKALPESDPYERFYTITLSSRGRVISQFPTEGYLLDALWSPNGTYVAVNNRRGSSGDYLRVL